MKKLVSLLLVLALCLTAVAAFAEDDANTGVYVVINETGEKITELYLMDNVTEDLGENLAVDDENDGLADGEGIELTYTIPDGEDGSHRLTLSFTTASGFNNAFETLSIEKATIVLRPQADVMSSATPDNSVKFADVTYGIYPITNLTGEKVVELYLTDNVTGDKTENLAGEGLAADATVKVAYEFALTGNDEDKSHRLTLSFKTEGGYEGSFATLSIEKAPIYLLAEADVATGATQISFIAPQK